MKHVVSRKDLKHCADKYVLVLREDLVYVRIGSEYVAKPYFSAEEVCKILTITYYQFHGLVQRLGIQLPERKHRRFRITLQQLRELERHKPSNYDYKNSSI